MIEQHPLDNFTELLIKSLQDCPEKWTFEANPWYDNWARRPSDKSGFHYLVNKGLEIRLESLYGSPSGSEGRFSVQVWMNEENYPLTTSQRERIWEVAIHMHVENVAKWKFEKATEAAKKAEEWVEKHQFTTE